MELKTLLSWDMYERFTFHIDHEAFHSLLNINDASGLLICWLLRLAEFDFEVKYKKGNADIQVDALSCSNTMSEAIPHYDNDDIPMFLLYSVNLELEQNNLTPSA